MRNKCIIFSFLDYEKEKKKQNCGLWGNEVVCVVLAFFCMHSVGVPPTLNPSQLGSG